MTFERVFTQADVHPFDAIAWKKVNAIIYNSDNTPMFEQKDVEAPVFWSQNAINIVANKYFYGKPDSPERETSIKQLISRVVTTIQYHGHQEGYFDDIDQEYIFADELTYILLHQKASFNSPIWFNCGTKDLEIGQSSACFINSIGDSISEITDFVKTEAIIFKYGSGSGVNISPLRGKNECVNGGGTASGPISFMRLHDANAGTVKSGGKTRRAAKLVCMNVNHPDIMEFIHCKSEEEKKAKILAQNGYSFEEASDSVAFQNANHSVRVTDEFMRAALNNETYHTKAITTGEVVNTYNAYDILKHIAQEAWTCGDPGIQFHDRFNEWHTCPNDGEQMATNPCSEYAWLDDTSCNLASINLVSFYNKTENDEFSIYSFTHTARIMFTAQDILVNTSTYPTEKIAAGTKLYRNIGLGYTNLGAYLMRCGIAYDSHEGRGKAAAITALLTATAYATSATLSKQLGAFPRYEHNKQAMGTIILKHFEAIQSAIREFGTTQIMASARKTWNNILDIASETGFRNAQVSVLAPTGTISFMMDCDTTGVEPELSLIKHKALSEGGNIRIENESVFAALCRLGYTEDDTKRIIRYYQDHHTLVGSIIQEQHLPVFDCALPDAAGRVIQYMAHIRMLSAVQPFISGSISKTINVPNETTVAEVADLYLESWKRGLKCVSIYRDGSKTWQPLTTTVPEKAESTQRPQRTKLPSVRDAKTHKFTIGGHEGYVTVGIYPDGSPGELFIVINKEGSTISGLMDGFATAVSMALQYGVPLEKLCDKFEHMRFEPSGFTGNKDIPMAKSILDYIFRWLRVQFLTEKQPSTNGTITKTLDAFSNSGPPCSTCGNITIRQGTCYYCTECGSTSGCS